MFLCFFVCVCVFFLSSGLYVRLHSFVKLFRICKRIKAIFDTGQWPPPMTADDGRWPLKAGDGRCCRHGRGPRTLHFHNLKNNWIVFPDTMPSSRPVSFPASFYLFLDFDSNSNFFSSDLLSVWVTGWRQRMADAAEQPPTDEQYKSPVQNEPHREKRKRKRFRKASQVSLRTPHLSLIIIRVAKRNKSQWTSTTTTTTTTTATKEALLPWRCHPHLHGV